RWSGYRRSRCAQPSRPGDLGDAFADLGAARSECEVDEEFAVALRPGDGRSDDRSRAETMGHSGHHDPIEDLAMDRRVAHDAAIGPALASLELRLDERDYVVAGTGAERLDDRTEDDTQRDERHVDGREVDGFGEGRGRQVPGVGPLHRDDARVAAERFGELSATHVESVDPARAALQQDI